VANDPWPLDEPEVAPLSSSPNSSSRVAAPSSADDEGLAPLPFDLPALALTVPIAGSPPSFMRTARAVSTASTAMTVTVATHRATGARCFMTSRVDAEAQPFCNGT
jgi:hypothetical protein